MGYCGNCNTHNITFTDRICDNCGFDGDNELEVTQRTLQAVRSSKRKGWERYPNDLRWGKPIDDVLARYEQRVSSLLEQRKLKGRATDPDLPEPLTE